MGRGLKQILTEDFDSVELGEAKDACSAIDLISRKRWDAVVLDINLPGKNGLDLDGAGHGEVFRKHKEEYQRRVRLFLNLNLISEHEK